MSIPQERLSGITVFVQVVEAGSFAEAAARMNVTRSAVSKTIGRLEQRLKVRLFQRTTRSLSLTEVGQIYYERCLRALMELDQAEAALDKGQREPSGRLRVSVPVLFGRNCVAPVLRELTDQYDTLDVEISFTDRVIDLVEEGFDLAVRVGKLPDTPNLVARPLGVQQMAIWAAPSYLSRHGRPGDAEEIAKHAGIVYGRSGSVAPWRLVQTDGRVVTLAVNGRLCFDDLQAIADAAVAGQGLAWLPCWLVHQQVQNGTLEPVIGGDQMLGHPINAVWPSSYHLPSKTRTAIDALVAQMPPLLAFPTQDLDSSANGSSTSAAAPVP